MPIASMPNLWFPKEFLNNPRFNPAPAPKPAAKPFATVTGIIRQNQGEYGMGKVFATVEGKKRIVGEGLDSWLAAGGRYVAFSGPDGAGGYENEGQSLRVYDTQTNTVRKVMGEYAMVDKVSSAKSSDGRTALLVAMSDGGLGADHLAVVHPEKGQVFEAHMARALKIENGKMTVGYYTEENYGDDGLSGKPYKTVTYDLGKLLDKKGVVRKYTENADGMPTYQPIR